jgi:UDP-N-acetylmuramate dehydrogenase
MSGKEMHFLSDLKKQYSGKIYQDFLMSQLTTFKVGGGAEIVVFPENRVELEQLISFLALSKVQSLVIGRGSNILAPDAGLKGLVIVLGSEYGEIEYFSNEIKEELGDKKFLRVQAGCSLARLNRFCIEKSLKGLEFLIGIPGTVGGAVAMNAGAWGKDIGSVVNTVWVMKKNGTHKKIIDCSSLFSYRKWHGAEDMIIESVLLQVELGRKDEIIKKCRELINKRKQSQPHIKLCAGSFFKNPDAGPAGKFIEEAGLKGFKIGGAAVSEKHANFIVNTGNASSNDIIVLMKHIQKTILDDFEINLEPEVQIL